jgi:hypothetical protein
VIDEFPLVVLWAGLPLAGFILSFFQSVRLLAGDEHPRDRAFAVALLVPAVISSAVYWIGIDLN